MKEYPARLYMGGFPPYEVMHQFSYSRVAAALRALCWPMLSGLCCTFVGYSLGSSSCEDEPQGRREQHAGCQGWTGSLLLTWDLRSPATRKTERALGKKSRNRMLALLMRGCQWTHCRSCGAEAHDVDQDDARAGSIILRQTCEKFTGRKLGQRERDCGYPRPNSETDDAQLGGHPDE